MQRDITKLAMTAAAAAALLLAATAAQARRETETQLEARLALGEAGTGETGTGEAGDVIDRAMEKLDAKIDGLDDGIDRIGRAVGAATEDAPATAGTPATKGAAPGPADPDLAALLEHRRSVEAMRHNPANNQGAVAILVPIAFFTLVAMLVFIPLFLRNRRRALDAAVQRAAIEAGQQYIPELPARPLPRRNDRRTGAIVAGVGVALAAPFLALGHPEVAVFGLAPIVLGVVYFLVGALLPAPDAE